MWVYVAQSSEGPPFAEYCKSTWPGKPSAAGAVNYLASVGTILLPPYNTIVQLLVPPPRHTLRLRGPITIQLRGPTYYLAARWYLPPPPWPPPYNAQPLQPSCKPLTTPCSSLPTTHVIPFWSPNTTLSARSTHLFISHPFFCPVHRWVSSGNSSWPPGGSAGPKFRRRSLSPFILFNTGD